MSNKKFYIFLLNVIGILLLNSCNGLQSRKLTEPPQNFPLSSMRLTTDDLPGQWDWVYLDSDQGSLTPTSENNFSSEYASAYLVGHNYFKDQKFTFTIYHDVRNYVKTTPMSEAPFTDSSFGETFSIRLVKIDGDTDSRCSRQPNTKSNPIFLCEILVNYEYIQSFLRITGDVNAGQQMIESLINQILTNIDNRIESR